MKKNFTQILFGFCIYALSIVVLSVSDLIYYFNYGLSFFSDDDFAMGVNEYINLGFCFSAAFGSLLMYSSLKKFRDQIGQVKGITYTITGASLLVWSYTIMGLDWLLSIPWFMGSIIPIILVYVALIYNICGYSQLGSKSNVSNDVWKGTRIVAIGYVLYTVSSLSFILPFIGYFLEIVLNVAFFICVVVGWSKVRNVYA